MVTPSKGILHVSLVNSQGKGKGQTAPACSTMNDESWLLAFPLGYKLRQSLVEVRRCSMVLMVGSPSGQFR
jgi:hypothetical protein